MKTLHFCFAFLLVSFNSYSQFGPNTGVLYPASGMEKYQMTEEMFNHQLIHRVFTNKETGKPELEFIRYDADNFIRVEYDNTGKQQRKGIISPNKEKAPHYKIKMPDLVKDPDMSKGITKDTVLYDEYYDKNGYWEEATTDGKQWQGYYNHDVKTGVWKKVLPGPSPIDSFAVYQNGVLVSNAYASSSATQLFPMLAGNWFADRASSGRMYQVYYRKPATASDKEFIEFVSPTEFTLHTNQEIQKASWSFENNQLNLSIAGHASKVAIVYVDDQTLIVQNLAN